MNRNDSIAAIVIRLLCAVAVTAMALISFIVYKANAAHMLIFVFFFVFYVQLPGFLVTGLIDADFRHLSERLLVSSFAGWALAVAVYFIAALTGARILLYCAGPLLSLLYLYMLYSRRLEPALYRKFRPRKVSAAFCVMVVILMAYIFLNTQFIYLSPEYSQNTMISIDKAYQGGLINALSHGYPINSPWVYGVTEYYHIFTQALLSVPLSLFGLTADFLILSASPYLSVYFISLSFYAMFRHFCRRSDRAGLYTLSVVLSNMFIARTPVSSYLFRILFVNDNHGGFAISCLIACLIMTDIFFRPASRASGDRLRLLAFTAALYILLTGIKAPVALVLVGGVIGTWLLGLILRQITFRESFPFVISVVTGFIIIFVLFIGGDNATEAGDASILRFGKMTNICFWKDGLIEALKSAGIPSSVRLLAILAVFFLFYFTIYALPFAFGYLREFCLVVSKKKTFSFGVITAYAAALVGFVLMMFLNYYGHSQAYFGAVTTAFAPLIAFRFLEDLPDMTSKTMTVICKASAVWFFAAIIVTSLTLAVDIKGMVPDAVYHADPSSEYNPYMCLSSDEYKATQWLRENTPADSVIATQMYASMPREDYDYRIRWNSCHFMYATYSDRQFYLEGSGFSLDDSRIGLRLEMIKNTDALYDPDNTGRGDLARTLGVDYVMVTKKIFPTPDLSSGDYTLVFSNDDVDIYQVTA